MKTSRRRVYALPAGDPRPGLSSCCTSVPAPLLKLLGSRLSRAYLAVTGASFPAIDNVDVRLVGEYGAASGGGQYAASRAGGSARRGRPGRRRISPAETLA